MDDPDQTLLFPPAACRGCGAGLAGEPVAAQRRHRVTDIEPAPAPKVTEHVAQAKECPCCGVVTEGELAEHVRARASFGPEVSAQAANLTAGHHIPVYRATLLLCRLAGITVSTGGWPASCTPGAGAHLLRDLKDLHYFEPGKQDWAQKAAGLLIEARDAACAARLPGQSALDTEVLDGLVTRYRVLAAAGLTANLYRRTATAGDARGIARRLLSFEDMILRFATRPDLDISSNNQAERTIRPVKVQQRSSGGCWRTLEGLADFGVTQCYLSTAAKWGISKPDALRDLFNGHAWLPPGLEPAG